MSLQSRPGELCVTSLFTDVSWKTSPVLSAGPFWKDKVRLNSMFIAQTAFLAFRPSVSPLPGSRPLSLPLLLALLISEDFFKRSVPEQYRGVPAECLCVLFWLISEL